MGTEEGDQELRDKAAAKIGSCPVCKGERRLPWGSLSWPSDRLQECRNFQALNPQQRAVVIQEQGGYVVCLSWGHHKFRCNMVQHHNEGGPGIGCEEREGAGVCGQLHHRLLHGSRSAHTSTSTVAGLQGGQGGCRQDLFLGKPTGSLLTEGTAGAIFKILEAPVVSTKGKKTMSLVFINPGSTINFITHELAGQLQLEGTLCKISIKK